MTAPFFDSTSPLSLECRGRDLVCSISNLFQHRRHSVVYELASVVGMEATNLKRKLLQNGLQHWFEPCFRYLFRSPDHLPLRHLHPQR